MGNNKPLEMRICEVDHIVLRLNVAYIFTVDPNCKACVKYASAYDDDPASVEEVKEPLIQVLALGHNRHLKASRFSNIHPCESYVGNALVNVEICGTHYNGIITKEQLDILNAFNT